jgi:hypothetical protein
MATGGKKPQRRSAGDTAKGPFSRPQRIKAGEILGEDCPVRALGHNDSTFYFCDPVGQVRAMRSGEMTPNGLIGLFMGDVKWLERECPTDSERKRSKGTDRTTWHNPTAVQRLVSACRREGFFDPQEQTRGPGIWPFNAELLVGEDFAGSDQLVIHAGSEVGLAWFEDGKVLIEWENAGVKIGDFVYPAFAPTARPGDVAATDEEVEAFLAMLDRWNWRDGASAKWLAFGFIATCFMPAAMPFRPTGYVQGRSGCGKSSFMQLAQYLIGDRALKYDNGTAARVREDFAKRNDVRTVIINEAEVSEDNKRILDLIEMARYVYTPGEGKYGRGGSGGSKSAINANFLFVAVEPPPLLPQDANRIAMLRLGPLSANAEQMEAFEIEMPALGRALGPKLARRMLEVWPLFPSTLSLFRKGLMAHRHSQRTANTFGVLLSAAHLIRFGAVPDDSDVQEWASSLDAKLLASRDISGSTERNCLLHLVTHRVGPYRSGELAPLGEYVRKALWGEPSDAASNNKVIRGYGLAVVKVKLKGQTKPSRYVAVSNKHQGLMEIFRGSQWGKGGHVETLRMLRGAIASPRAIWFLGSQDRCTLIPEEYFPDQLIALGDGAEENVDEDREEQERRRQQEGGA